MMKIKNLVKKKPAEDPTEKESTNIAFPVKELRNWLKGREYWDHNDWLNLLDNLRKEGYSQFTDSEEGRTQIGQFLEKERGKK